MPLREALDILTTCKNEAGECKGMIKSVCNAANIFFSEQIHKCDREQLPLVIQILDFCDSPSSSLTHACFQELLFVRPSDTIRLPLFWEWLEQKPVLVQSILLRIIKTQLNPSPVLDSLLCAGQETPERHIQLVRLATDVFSCMFNQVKTAYSNVLRPLALSSPASTLGCN
jgi:hypothetical protein